MRRRPTNRSENIISKGMLARITATGVYMSVVFLLQYKLNFLGAARGEMTTVLFTLFVLFQLFNAFNCRELHSESIFCHLFKNKLMLLVVGCTFVLQVLIIQFAGAFLAPYPWGSPCGASCLLWHSPSSSFLRSLRFLPVCSKRKRHNKKHNHWIKNKTVCTKRYIRPFVIFDFIRSDR